ncbi:MAG: hypothetical protein ACI3XD_01090 [Oscillospiraceae bacterium]
MKKVKIALLFLFCVIFIPLSNYVKVQVSISSPTWLIFGWEWLSCLIFGVLLYFLAVDGPFQFKPDAICIACAILIAATLIAPKFLLFLNYAVGSATAGTFIRVSFAFALTKGLFRPVPRSKSNP